MELECSTYLTAVIEVVKSLAWPVAIGGGILFFRRDIRSLVPRMKKLGPGGIEIAPDQAAQQVSVERLAQMASDPGLPTPRPALATMEERLRKELVATYSADKQIPLLLRELATARLIAAFERIYRAIFGSQLLLLKKLNQVLAMPTEVARACYAEAAFVNDKFYEGFSYEKWVQFLIGTELARIEGDTLAITEFGKEFLVYMTTLGMSDEKPN